MQANLYATFRLIAHTKTLALDLPAGTSVAKAVDSIVERLPDLRKHWLDSEGEVHAHVHIFVNGNDVAGLPDGMETPLAADAVLDFFPPVGGG